MRKRKKNEFLKPDSIIPNEDDYDNLIKAEEEYDESARLKKLVMLFVIPLVFILGFLYKSKFQPEIKIDKLEEFKTQQQAEINQKNLVEFSQIILDAENASMEKDFNRAVFLFRQAISYQPQNIEIYEKLVATLEESCKEDNEIHCNAIENAKNKLENLKERK